MGQSPAAIHSQAVPYWGHMHILRLQAQVQLGHVITKPGEGGVVRKAKIPVLTIQVTWSDLGQVFTAGVQIVVVLKGKIEGFNLLFSIKVSGEGKDNNIHTYTIPSTLLTNLLNCNFSVYFCLASLYILV